MKHKAFKADRDVPDWAGPTARYDLLREVTICFVVVLVLVVGLAVVFSSPDDPPVTLRSWSRALPVDFVQTATTELAGTRASPATGRRTTRRPAPASASGRSRSRSWPGFTSRSTPPRPSSSAHC